MTCHAAEDHAPALPARAAAAGCHAPGKISGSHHRGRWTDVGTPARLAQLDAELVR